MNVHELLLDLLTREDKTNDPSALELLNGFRKMRRQESELSDLRVNFELTCNDRDARRTRMELAQHILDYENNAPIQDLWGVIIGTHVILDKDQYSRWNHIVNTDERPVGQPRTFGIQQTANELVPEMIRAGTSDAKPRLNGICPRNPIVPYNHQWGAGLEPECIHGCGVRLLLSQSEIARNHYPDPTATPTPVYVCPQCGPDPAGEQVHAQTRHIFAGIFKCDGNHGGPPCVDPQCWAIGTPPQPDENGVCS